MSSIQKSPDIDEKYWIRFGFLCFLLVGFGTLLFFQTRNIQREKREKAEKIAERLQLKRHYQKVEQERSLHQRKAELAALISRREEEPLEIPDYLDEKPFFASGDITSLSEAALKAAQAAKKDIKNRKLLRAGATLNRPLSIPSAKTGPSVFDIRQKYLKYRMREFEAFQTHTLEDGPAKKACEEFLLVYLQHASRVPNAPNHATVKDLARRVFALNVQDPMIRTYAAYSRYMEDGDAVLAELVWADSIKKLRESQYPRIVHVYLRTFALDSANATERFAIKRRDALIVSIIKWLEEDSHSSQWADCVYEKLNKLWTCSSTPVQKGILYGCLESSKIDPFIVHNLLGDYHFRLAWQKRGSQYAIDIAPERWEGFKKHLRIAQSHLEFAWWHRPDSPYAPTKLISISMAGEDSEYQPEDWFRRAVEARFDFWGAYNTICTTFHPGWGGRVRQFPQFARQCLETNRFDTQVPYFFIEIFDIVRLRQFRGNWSQIRELGEIEEFLKRFDQGQGRYKRLNPGETVYGESSHFHSRLGWFCQNLGLEERAREEYRKADGNIVSHVIQKNNRAGWHLLRRLFASTTDDPDRVFRFDQRLRKRWSSDTKKDDFRSLRRELKDLQGTANDEYSKKYFQHADRILSHLETFHANEWVDLNFDGEGLGWEIRADRIEFTENKNEIVLWGTGGQSQQVWAYPLAHFSPPFIVEAEFEQLPSYRFPRSIGIHWTKPVDWILPDWTSYSYEMDELFIGLSAEWGVSDDESVQNASEKNLQMVCRQEVKRVIPNRVPKHFLVGRRAPIPNSLSQSGHRWKRDAKPKPRKMTWRLWSDNLEYRVGDFWKSIPFDQALTNRGQLGFGECKLISNTVKKNHCSGVFRIANVRIRKLNIGQPPPNELPLETKEQYWEKRLALTDDDFLAHLRLCEISAKRGEHEQALKLADEIIARWPGLHGIHRFRGLALLQLRQYQAALESLEIAFREPRDDVEVALGKAMIFAAAPIDELRDGNKAFSMVGLASSIGHRGQPRTLGVRAATLAERGDYAQAAETNRQAMQSAKGTLLEDLKKRQELYESGKPFRLPKRSE